MRVVVIGAGIAGLGAALAFGERGHEVIVLDRDTSEPPAARAAVFDQWERPGVPHFRNPHSFVSLGRKIVRERLPAVFEDLIAAGALDIKMAEAMPGGPSEDGDRDIALLGCRRPIIESVVRRAAQAHAGVRLLLGARVEELMGRGTPPRISGVRTQRGEVIEADLVVDASGRSSRLGLWLTALDGRRPAEEYAECGVTYYSRYFRYRGDVRLPMAPSPLGPRGDLGYMAYATFPADNDTWAFSLNTPTWRPEFHALRDAAVHLAVGRSIPAVCEAIEPANSEPITGVLPMGGLRNSTRDFVTDGRPIALGVIAIGDALAHTNPAFAWGLSLGLEQAFGLAALADDHHGDLESIALAFDRTYGAHARDCYRAARDIDLARLRVWRGQAEPPKAADGPEAALFFITACFAAGFEDRDIFRAAFRRAQLLDPLDKLPSDRALLDRAAAIVASRAASAKPARRGPSEDEMLALLAAGAPTPAT